MEALGIDYKLIIGQITNFLILFFILSYFLYKPVVKILEDRRKKIAESIENNQEIEKKLLNTENATQQILSQARDESAKIIEEATKLSKDEKDKIITASQVQAEKIIQNAEKEALRIKNEITTEAKKDIGNIVILALEKIVNNELNDAQKKELVSKAIKNI